MFNVGEKVVYGSSGVYEISSVTTLDNAIAAKDKLYYVLKNIETAAMAYIPTDSNVYIRSVMSTNEAYRFISEIPNVASISITASNPKELPRICKEVLSSHDLNRTLGLVKCLKVAEKKKQLQRKKLSITEERYLSQALMVLSSELSVALDKTRGELERMILEEIEK